MQMQRNSYDLGFDARIRSYFDSQRRLYPCNANRASEMGHECVRYLVYLRTRWQDRALHSIELQQIFNEGNLHEEGVLNTLRAAGFQVWEQQKTFTWPKYNINGHLDAKIGIEDKYIPAEIKSMSSNNYASVDSISDMINSKHHYMRRYPTQINLYLLMDNKEQGAFILKNKQNGQLKFIPVDLDYDIAESAVRKAEMVNECIANGTIPPRIDPINEELCGECSFNHICLPDMAFGSAPEFSDDAELLAKIQRYEEIKPIAKEYDLLDEEIKKISEGRDKIIIGDYILSGKYQTSSKFDIPKDVKEQYKATYQYWKKSIVRLNLPAAS